MRDEEVGGGAGAVGGVEGAGRVEGGEARMNAEVEENTLGVGPHPRKSSELHYCTHTVGVLPY